MTMVNHYGGMSLNEMCAMAKQVRATLEGGMSNVEDSFRNESTDALALPPIAYWNNNSVDFENLSETDKSRLFKELLQSHATMIAFVQNLIYQAAKLSVLVESCTEGLHVHDEELIDKHQAINELWHLVDTCERELINSRARTRSFAIIGGGKNHESNIPGRDEPNTSASGKSSESIAEDSS